VVGGIFFSRRKYQRGSKKNRGEPFKWTNEAVTFFWSSRQLYIFLPSFFLFQCVHVYNSRNMCVCALRWAIPAQTV
jgi:hypothetical protein